MKRKERDKNAEPDQQQKINVALHRSRNRVRGRGGLQFPNVKSSRGRWQTLVKQNQSDQQNETAEGEINCDFPRCDAAIARSPDSDEQKCRDQSEFVEGVKEKQID